MRTSTPFVTGRTCTYVAVRSQFACLPAASTPLRLTFAFLLPLPSHLAVPKGLTAAGGIDTLVHAIESYVSIFATDYTKASSVDIAGVIA